MKRSYKKLQGVTLLEVLLVLVIVSSLMVMLLGYVTQKSEETRRDRVTLQLQQVLNAGMTFFVNNGNWPASLAALQPTFLPATFNNPWGQAFTVASNPNGTLSVSTNVLTIRDAGIVAGRLPLSSVAGTTVTASVNIPGQNLNNARAVNFAGIYHPGACVPAPRCPTPSMVPDILVVPVSVSGLNDPASVNVYPISSFTAYAYGRVNGTAIPSTLPVTPRVGRPAGCNNPADTNVRPCEAGAATTIGGRTIPAGVIDMDTPYWRVCLKIITERGDVNSTANFHWGGNVSVMAITRCVPANEPSGSNFSVWLSGNDR